MAKSVSDSEPDSKPVSSLFWRSVLNADEPRPPSALRPGPGHVKSEEKPQCERGEGTDRLAKSPTAIPVKQENRPGNDGSCDFQHGRPQQPPPPPHQNHHPVFLPTGSAAVPSSSTTTATTRRPIQQYPAEIWETHKAHLYHLYIQQGKSLKQIQQVMAQRGFNASDKMYKDRFSKWGFRKNRRALMRERLETPVGSSSSSSHNSNTSIIHAHHRGSSGSSGDLVRADDMMMRAPHVYAATTTKTRDDRQPHGGWPLVYFQGAIYDNRPRLPDTYLVQDQLLRCFDGMVARAWAAGELKSSVTNRIMYVTPEVHRKLVRLFNVNDYASTLAEETPYRRPSAVMRKGYESVSTFLKNPSMLGFLRLLQLTIYTGQNTQLPAVWHYIANSSQLRNCSVPGLHEVCRNMGQLIESYPPSGSPACSPFVDLVTNWLPRLEAMVPPPTTTPMARESEEAPATPLRQLREMLRRLLLATSHRHSLSEALKRYARNSEQLVRELLEHHERLESAAEEGGGGGRRRRGRWPICAKLSAGLPKEIRLDLAIFSAFKRADENGDWCQDGEYILDRMQAIEREEGQRGDEPPMDDLQRRLLLIIQSNVHHAFWRRERERQTRVSRPPPEQDTRRIWTKDPGSSSSSSSGSTTTTTTTSYYRDNSSNARLEHAIALRRKAMEYITGPEQREHGERFEDLMVLETWYREMGDASLADEAVRQGDREIALHLATLTI
ncbi:uncharacterized protein PG998_015102 [Apiospora kogelbergensis]|uniref:uncharacterized protein n=1 Tax=Apiospora kogelbergensis TaxID=1337665 RepID=UPI0031311692